MGPPFSERISQVLEEIYWAPGQGALAVETREDNEEVIEILKCIHDSEAYATCTSERAFLEALGGGCQVPLGVKTKISEDGKTLELQGRVLTLDGKKQVEGETTGPASDPISLGKNLAVQLVEKGAETILSSVREQRNPNPSESRPGGS